MTHAFVKSGGIYTIANREAVSMFDELPPSTFVLGYNDMKGEFFMKEVDSFDLPEKTYGDLEGMSKRILSTMHNRPASTGVLLTGTKGTGKTLLAKMLSVKGAEENMPTIIINTPFKGDKFNTFIQSINQECIIFFDEFEKVYTNEEQSVMLTLLDGTFPSKKLFVLTCNDKYRINHFMINRPGRIYYNISFERMSESVIEQYINENLINKDHKAELVLVTQLFGELSFDMLKAIVEEMNRYGETAQEALKLLNVSYHVDNYVTYIGTIFTPDKREVQWSIEDNLILGTHPLALDSFDVKVDLKVDEKKESVEEVKPLLSNNDEDWDLINNDENWDIVFHVTPDKLKSVDPVSGRITYQMEDGSSIVYEKERPQVKSYNLSSLV